MAYFLDTTAGPYTRLHISSKSTLSLIAANLITIAMALWQNWRLADVMWVYWMQSVIIGYFQQKKIRDLEEFSTERFLINDHPVEPTEKTKRFVANFFIFHYGLFHLVYFMFLNTLAKPEIAWLLPLGMMFFLNHYFSYMENRERDRRRIQNIGSMMFFPYLRIVPMHLTLIFGTAFKNVSIIIFLLLKTTVDTVMHSIEHSGDLKAVTDAKTVN